MTLRSGTPAEAGLSPARLDVVRARCAEWIADGTHPALVALVARRGVVAFHEAFGSAVPDSVFSIASISKPMTATALMLLVEDGLVGLTRPVQEYIPEAAEGICVHHLLTHTSGIRDEDVIERIMARFSEEVGEPEPTQHPWVHRTMTLAFGAPPHRRPGEQMIYANANYGVAGEIVRRVSGRSLADFANERIFRPLGMRDTCYGFRDELEARLVVPPPLAGETPLAAYLRTPEGRRTPTPYGGVHSTAADLAAFMQMFLDGGRPVLNRSSVAEMTRDQIPGIAAEMLRESHEQASWSYAFAIAGDEKWYWFPTLPRGAFNHGGGTGVYTWADPGSQLVGVFFSVVSRVMEDGRPVFMADLFANAVHAAVL